MNLPEQLPMQLHVISSNSSLGDWRNVICLVADDEDSSIHLDQTDALLNNLDPFVLKFNLDKIYLDAYQQESTPGGQRYPDVNEALNNRVEKGAFLVNYTGHGGELGWAHEDILNNTMINAWIINLTCLYLLLQPVNSAGLMIR